MDLTRSLCFSQIVEQILLLKDRLAIALEGDDVMLDYIPLHEVRLGLPCLPELTRTRRSRLYKTAIMTSKRFSTRSIPTGMDACRCKRWGILHAASLLTCVMPEVEPSDVEVWDQFQEDRSHLRGQTIYRLSSENSEILA